MFLIIFMKLTSIMGFSWLFGFLASVFSVPALWYIFVISTTLQGVHILLSFAMNKHAFICCSNISQSTWSEIDNAGHFCEDIDLWKKLFHFVIMNELRQTMRSRLWLCTGARYTIWPVLCLTVLYRYSSLPRTVSCIVSAK